MPLYKRCSSCRQQLPMGTKCECTKKRHKEYDYYTRDKKSSAFYSSKEWQEARQKAIDKSAGIDLYSLYVLGIIEYGQTVHHIEELKENYNRRLDLTNLIYLTESNHQLIHKEYNKGKIEKVNMQCLLFDLLRRYEEDKL